MNQRPPKREPDQLLISVERQVEHNVLTGERSSRCFVKMYFEARESGLLADLPDDLWKLLCVLATYIDEHGVCFPSQTTLAGDLGVGRQAVNARVRRLREYRFHGQPVLAVRGRNRVRSKKGQSRYGSNVYRLLPVTGFSFGSPKSPKPQGEFSMSRQHDIEESSVSPQHDTDPELSVSSSVSSSVSPVTRHEQDGTRSEQDTRRVASGRELVRKFLEGLQSGRTTPAAKEVSQATELISRLGQEAAEFVVSFALNEARRTSFPMKRFGAVLYLEEEAIEARRRVEHAGIRRETETRKRHREALKTEYSRWRAQVLRESVDALPPNVRAEIEEAVREELLPEYGGKPGFETLVSIGVRERVAAQKEVPEFKDWWQMTQAEARTKAG